MFTNKEQVYNDIEKYQNISMFGGVPVTKFPEALITELQLEGRILVVRGVAKTL